MITNQSITDRKCDICDALLKYYQKNFCSRKCSAAAKHKATLETRPLCETCGEKPVSSSAGKFCSHKCAGKERQVRHLCPACKEEWLPPRRKYCSKECMHKALGHETKRTYICHGCGTEVERFPSTVRNPDRVYHSSQCRAINRVYAKGPDHPQWKPEGWRYVRSDGYIEVGRDKDRHLEHRVVMEQVLGRPLLSTETVHHINGNKTDNRPENLQLRQGKHGKGSVMQCSDCGSPNIKHAPIADSTSQ